HDLLHTHGCVLSEVCAARERSALPRFAPAAPSGRETSQPTPAPSRPRLWPQIRQSIPSIILSLTGSIGGVAEAAGGSAVCGPAFICRLAGTTCCDRPVPLTVLDALSLRLSQSAFRSTSCPSRRHFRWASPSR